MHHDMRLKLKPFDQIRRQTKTIEARLYDAKRQQVRVDDTITFICPDNQGAAITVRVTDLSVFSHFLEMFQGLGVTDFGFDPVTTPTQAAHAMTTYYSLEDQQQAGVVGIHITVVQTQTGPSLS
jgi:ASC-1-like (ASCH) protein